MTATNERANEQALAEEIFENEKYEIYNDLVMTDKLRGFCFDVQKLLEKLCSSAVSYRTRSNSRNAQLEFMANFNAIKTYFENKLGIKVEKEPCDHSGNA